MLKNMKLSAKMFTGFGILIVITAVLSGISWYVLHTVEQTVASAEEANHGILFVQTLRQHEKDFLANGFTVPEGQTENAADRWGTVKDELQAQMLELASIDSMHEEDLALISQTQDSIASYGESFEMLTASRQEKDDAFASWGKLGWEITSGINDAKDNVINPALAAAFEQKDTEQIQHWSSIKKSLDEEFIQNFLVLRICGIYLVATDKDAQWEGLNKQLAKTKDGIASWTSIVDGNSELETAASGIQVSLTAYEAAAVQYYNAIKTQRAAITEMTDNAQKTVEGLESMRTKLSEEVDSFTVMANTLSISLTTFGVVTGCFLAFFITRSIVKPINQIIRDLSEGAAQVSSASTEVSSASQSLAEGATEQAAGLEETSSSLEEMSSMTKQNADNAQQANILSDETSTSANEGSQSMGRMSSAIEEIRKSSDETAKIIKVIDEIAFQTNLLALNAAVEAARAGEAGKGFAVVAEEVRNLAIRSAEAAKNTSALIEESVRNSQNGVEISNEVGKVFEEIVGKIEKTSNLVGEIAAASSEQAQGIDQVNTAVSQMDKVTQQNAANAEESASASEELNAQAEQMNLVVHRLATLVSGGSAEENAGGRTLAASDDLYHQIADRPATSSQTSVAQNVTSDGFEDF